MPTSTAPNCAGPPLAPQLSVGPIVQLAIYDNGIAVLRRRDLNPHDPESGFRVLEYAVEPTEIARAMSANVAVSTGLLPPDVLWVTVNGIKRTVASYRPPQVTGIWLEGSDTPLRIPLPGLVLIHGGERSRSELYAVKGNPRDPTTVLYVTPLPNVYGSVCWGTVSIPTFSNNDLGPVWTNLLGSRFANHAAGQKSKRYPNDVRKLLLSLENKKRYPISDLVPHKNIQAKDKDGNPKQLTIADVMPKGT